VVVVNLRRSSNISMDVASLSSVALISTLYQQRADEKNCLNNLLSHLILGIRIVLLISNDWHGIFRRHVCVLVDIIDDFLNRKTQF
jgi:hypothetical protein